MQSSLPHDEPTTGGGTSCTTTSSCTVTPHRNKEVDQVSTTSYYPMKDIEEIHDHDVLCGRGGIVNTHVGNVHWRMLVAANKQLYSQLNKKQKQMLSRSIVHAVRTQRPMGRFLQRQGPQSALWCDVGDARAVEKTSQALREGNPQQQQQKEHPDAPELPPRKSMEPVWSEGSNYSTSLQILAQQHEEEDRRALAREDVPHAASNHTNIMDTAAIPMTTVLEGNEFSVGSMMVLNEQEEARLFEDEKQNGAVHDAQQEDCIATPGQVFSALSNQEERGYLSSIGAVLPVDGGLEGTTMSIGSMMSVGTLRLDDMAGQLSLGSAMSYQPNLDSSQPQTVDGGLEAIGTSFGSMSISTMKTIPEQSQQYRLKRDVGPGAHTGEEPTPTLLAQSKSKGSLLEWSDSDDDSEENSSALKAQKSQNWLKFKTEFELGATTSTSRATSAESSGLMPPPMNRPLPSSSLTASLPSEVNNLITPNSFIHCPETEFDRDISGMSLLLDSYDPNGVGGTIDGEGNTTASAAPGIPVAMPLEQVDSEELERTLLSRGDSLAAEEFLSPLPK